MTEKEKVVPGGVSRRRGDDQPNIEPEIVEPEVVESDPSPSWVPGFHPDSEQLPFPLTPEKLARLVQQFDVCGPMQLGVFYLAILRKECSLLLPQPVYGFNDGRFATLLATWNQNFIFFKCRAIGEVLAWYETMRWKNADYKK